MPIFDFTCRNCGAGFEQLVLPQHGPPECPSCKSQDLEKMLSAFTVSSDQTRKAAVKSYQKRAKAAKHEEQHDHHKRLHGRHEY